MKKLKYISFIIALLLLCACGKEQTNGEVRQQPTVGGLDDDMLAEVAGGKNIFEAGADILSNRKVHRVLNVKGTVVSDQVGRMFGSKKDKSK